MAIQTKKVRWTKQHDGLFGMGARGYDRVPFDIPPGYQFTDFDAKVLAGRYKAGVRVRNQPGRGTTGKNKEARVHWWFDGGDQPFIKYQCTATFTNGTVTKNQRALLVVCDLADGGVQHFRQLYEWIESAGVMTVQHILNDDYKHVEYLTGSTATSANFVNSLVALAHKGGIKAIDAVLMLHGRINEIVFRDRALTGGKDGTIRRDLGTKNLGAELRVCFSTCCWGESVADDLVAAGFSVVCGSKDVYANGAYGMPIALHNWASSHTFAQAIAKANNQLIMAAADTIARKAHPSFATANSYWTISASKPSSKFMRITSRVSQVTD
jgi:hypothetical protein